MKLSNFPLVTCVMRGYNYKQIEAVASVIADNKNFAIEIASNNENCFEILAALRENFSNRLYIGAGTILNYKLALEAINSGAEFILSPVSYDEKIIALCKSKGIISIAGAYTPDEIYKSYMSGVDIIKVFPASNLGAKYFKSVLEPMENLKLMAVGGVNASNVMDYFDNGASYVASAGGIFNKKDILNLDTDALSKSIHDFESIIKTVCL